MLTVAVIQSVLSFSVGVMSLMLLAETSDTVALFSFLTFLTTSILGYLTFRLNKKQAETNVKLEANTEATKEQGKQLTGVEEKVVKIEKQTDGLATILGEAKLAQGLAQGGMQERNRADDKAEAKADAAPAVTESVKGIIAEYKAGELKEDVAGLIEDVKANPKATVDLIKKREGEP